MARGKKNGPSARLRAWFEDGNSGTHSEVIKQTGLPAKTVGTLLTQFKQRGELANDDGVWSSAKPGSNGKHTEPAETTRTRKATKSLTAADILALSKSLEEYRDVKHDSMSAAAEFFNAKLELADAGKNLTPPKLREVAEATGVELIVEHVRKTNVLPILQQRQRVLEDNQCAIVRAVDSLAKQLGAENTRALLAQVKKELGIEDSDVEDEALTTR